MNTALKRFREEAGFKLDIGRSAAFTWIRGKSCQPGRNVVQNEEVSSGLIHEGVSEKIYVNQSKCHIGEKWRMIF